MIFSNTTTVQRSSKLYRVNVGRLGYRLCSLFSIA